MERSKVPAFPKVLGILGMCFGVLGLLAGLALYGREANPFTVAAFGISLLHVAAGATTSQGRRVGPPLFILYGVAALAHGIFKLTSDSPEANPNQHHVDFVSLESLLASLVALVSVVWAITAIVLAAVVRRSCTR